MASRRRRTVLIILGGLLGLLVLAVVLLPLLVPREHLRQLAEQQVIAATGGEASLGPVSLRVLPRLRLVLGQSSAKVSADGLLAAGHDPGPLRAAEVSLARLEVDLALWPLFRRQLEFGEVRLVAPRLDVVTAPLDEDERVDPLDPLSVSVPGEIPPPTAMDYSLTLAAIEVRDGEVRWREDGTGREVVVRGWQQDAGAPHFGVLVQRLMRLRGDDLPEDAVDGPVALDLATRVATLALAGFGEAPLPPLEDLRLRGVLSLPRTADRADFTIDELSMTGWRARAAGHAVADRVEIAEIEISGGQAVALSGKAGIALPPHRGPLRCDLSGTVDLALIHAQIEPWLPPLPPDGPPVPDLTGSLRVSLAVDLTEPPAFDAPNAWADAWRRGLNGKAGLSARGEGLVVAMPEIGRPLQIGSIELVSDLRGAAGKTHLKATGLEHPALHGDAVLVVVPAVGEDQAVQARLELPTLDLDALAELAEAMQAAETRATASTAGRRWFDGDGFSLVATAWAAPGRDRLAASAPAPGELIPADLAVDLTATAHAIVFLGSRYTDARIEGALRQRVVEVSDFAAQVGTGRAVGKARLDYASDPRGKASWEMTIQEAPAGFLFAPYVPLLAEIWTGTLNARTSGSCDLADPQAILRSLHLAGDLQGSNGIIDLREQLADVSQYLGDRQDLLRVQYSQTSHRFRVEDGKVKIDGLRIDGRDTDWRGGGWLGLDGTLNLDLNVRLPAGFTPNLGDLTFLADALRDQDGRIALDFALTGDARRPVVKLNLDLARLARPEQLKKLEDEVKKGAESLLERLRRGR